MRAFIAIRMNATAETAIERFADELRPIARGIRWVPRINFHVTLRFLGNDAPPSKLEALGKDLAAIAKAAQPFKLTAQGAGGFPNLLRLRIIWIGLHGAELPLLAAKADEACQGAGFAPDDHPYSPHLTIGRVRDANGLRPMRAALERAADCYFGESIIDSMALYRSVPGGAAPAYLELARWRFGAD